MFNCHGYAWLITEGGPDRWIGYYAYEVGTYPDKYINDGSYTQITQMTHPCKVFWSRPSDHSAISSSQSGKVQSKWNKYPLMIHAPNYSPFGTNPSLKYYVKTTSITINGASSVACLSGSIYTLIPSPACIIQWNVTGPFSVSVNPSNSAIATVTNTYTSGSSGTLTASINGTVIGTRTISPCPPPITGPSTMCKGNSAVFSVSNIQAGFNVSIWGKIPRLQAKTLV